MTRALSLAQALALLPVLLLASCWVGDTPAPELPSIDLGHSESVPQVCDCLAAEPDRSAGLLGRAYRFTDMHIEEPYALAQLLNGIWAHDMDRDILNVLFSVQQALPSETGYPFREMSIVAASGWRSPEQLWLDEGQEAEEYCLQKSTESSMVMEPERECGGTCQVTTRGAGSINFYAGSQAQPLNCAPDLAVPHAIPITQLEARFYLDETCSTLVEGRMSACLERYAVERICMCNRDRTTTPPYRYDCVMNDPLELEPLPESPTPAAMTEYCGGCGTGPWFSLGAFLPQPAEGTGLPPCDPPIGDAGYKVSGVFTATEVTDRMMSTRKARCPEPAQGE